VAQADSVVESGGNFSSQGAFHWMDRRL